MSTFGKMSNIKHLLKVHEEPFINLFVLTPRELEVTQLLS